MKPLRLIIITTAFLGITHEMHAQAMLSASGGEATSNSGTVSFTIGQIEYQTNTSPTITIIEGVQQPYLVAVSGIKDENAGPDIILYPNPSTDFIILMLSETPSWNLNYQILDSSGRLLMDGKITGTETLIKIAGLSPADYYLRIAKSNMVIETFKIIKK